MSFLQLKHVRQGQGFWILIKLLAKVLSKLVSDVACTILVSLVHSQRARDRKCGSECLCVRERARERERERERERGECRKFLKLGWAMFVRSKF